MPASLPLLSPRPADRKTQILAAAAQVFAAKGYPRATTREIAQAAGVAEGTIYNHFASKHDLLVGIMAALAESEHLGEQLGQVEAADGRAFLAELLHIRQTFVHQNQAIFKVILSEILIDPHLAGHYYAELAQPALDLLEQHLRDRVAAGQMQPVDPRLAARLLMSVTTGLFVWDTLGDAVLQTRWEEMAGMMTSALWEGLRPA